MIFDFSMIKIIKKYLKNKALKNLKHYTHVLFYFNSTIFSVHNTCSIQTTVRTLRNSALNNEKEMC